MIKHINAFWIYNLSTFFTENIKSHNTTTANYAICSDLFKHQFTIKQKMFVLHGNALYMLKCACFQGDRQINI